MQMQLQICISIQPIFMYISISLLCLYLYLHTVVLFVSLAYLSTLSVDKWINRYCQIQIFKSLILQFSPLGLSEDTLQFRRKLVYACCHGIIIYHTHIHYQKYLSLDSNFFLPFLRFQLHPHLYSAFIAFYSLRPLSRLVCLDWHKVGSPPTLGK